jgi:hypothetical protein
MATRADVALPTVSSSTAVSLLAARRSRIGFAQPSMYANLGRRRWRTNRSRSQFSSPTVSGQLHERRFGAPDTHPASLLEAYVGQQSERET